MKICLIQPYYSMKEDDADLCFQNMLKQMDECDPSMDLIVLPEYCDVPVDVPNAAAFNRMVDKYQPIIHEKCVELARRCHALVFANYAEK
ncbi:MAG: hypothetical protein MJ099_05145, partial [Clostridia bacterium]|nr:hypothetical protein [Clostridia bacterium]